VPARCAPELRGPRISLNDYQWGKTYSVLVLISSVKPPSFLILHGIGSERGKWDVAASGPYPGATAPMRRDAWVVGDLSLHTCFIHLSHVTRCWIVFSAVAAYPLNESPWRMQLNVLNSWNQGRVDEWSESGHEEETAVAL
jgi:hypothetical protein